VTCSTGNDAECDAGTKPAALTCPATAVCPKECGATRWVGEPCICGNANNFDASYQLCNIPDGRGGYGYCCDPTGHLGQATEYERMMYCSTSMDAKIAAGRADASVWDGPTGHPRQPGKCAVCPGATDVADIRANPMC
jgi:hypothetical protein